MPFTPSSDTTTLLSQFLTILGTGQTQGFLADVSAKTLGESAALTSVRVGDSVWSQPTSGILSASVQGTRVVDVKSADVMLASGVALEWSSGFPGTNASDVFLRRDAANTLAQRNSTNGQAFNLYNTFTDTSNYERLEIGANAGGVIGANHFGIIVTKAGSGTQRDLTIGTESAVENVYIRRGGTNTWVFGSSGLAAITDNALDIGVSGTSRPRSLYLAAAALTTTAVTGLAITNSGELRRLITKVTLASTHAAYQAAALTADVTLAVLPAKTRVIGVIADTTTAWAGTAGTLAFTVGKTAGGNEYLLSHDVKSATVTKGLVNGDLGASIATSATTPVQGGDLPSWTATTNFQCRLTSGTGNLGTGAATNLTQGTTVFYIISEVYP